MDKKNLFYNIQVECGNTVRVEKCTTQPIKYP